MNNYSIFSRIVLCRVLKKYKFGVNNASSKKYCCEILNQIKDINILNVINKDIMFQTKIRKREVIEKLNKSKKWLRDNKNNLNIIVIHRDPRRIITSYGSFCDTVEVCKIDLLDINENGNIVVKTKKSYNKQKLYYFYGNWRRENITLNTYI